MERTAYKTMAGKELCRMLADHVDRTEPIQNWDECVTELITILANKADKKYRVPASVFFYAEIKNHLKRIQSKCRYTAKVCEEES